MGRELDPELTAAVAALIDRDPTTGLAAVAAALGSPAVLTSAQLGVGLDVLARALIALGHDEAANHAAAASLDPSDAERLYRLGYQLIELGLPAVAATALEHALVHAPGTEAIVTELCTAFERQLRYADARRLMARHPALCEAQFLCRYLLAWNAVMSGDLATARAVAPTLVPEEPRHQAMAERIAAMLARAARVAPVTTLDDRDLRGWHHVTVGGVLLHRSPYGLDAPMRGRYAWLQDSCALIASGVAQLAAVLVVWQWTPPCVYALPGRDHEAVARVVAHQLGVPLAPWPRVGAPAPGLVVIHDLATVPLGELARLRDRRPDQLVYAHAAPWTDDVAIAPDVVYLLHQSLVAPWGRRLVLAPDGGPPVLTEPDLRDAATLAASVLATTPAEDPDEEVAAALALAAVVGRPEPGPRPRWWAGGPVPSARM